MKSSRETQLPQWLARLLMTSVIAVIVLMPLHAFLSTWGGTAVGPLWLWKSWKEILLTVMGVATLGWLVSHSGARKIVFGDRLAQLVFAYVVLTLVMAAIHVGEVGLEATSAGLASNLRYMVIAFVALVLFRFAKWEWPSVSARALWYLTIVGLALAVVGILQVTVLPRDLLASFGYEKNTTIAPYMTIDENLDALRAFATLRGPNEYGALLIVMLIASLVVLKQMAWRLSAMVVFVAALFLSGSRSAWLGAGTAVVALVLLSYGSAFIRSKRFVYGAVAGLAVVAVTMFAAMSIPSVRLAVFHSSPGDSSLTEGSTEQHFLATAGGFERVTQNPLGCGPGCAGPASFYSDDARISENYYVQIAEEVGVVGLALWFAIAWQVVRRLYGVREDLLARTLLASFIGLSAIGLWLHVWADDPLSLTWWGLAGAVLGYYASAKPQKTVR